MNMQFSGCKNTQQPSVQETTGKEINLWRCIEYLFIHPFIIIGGSATKCNGKLCSHVSVASLGAEPPPWIVATNLPEICIGPFPAPQMQMNNGQRRRGMRMRRWGSFICLTGDSWTTFPLMMTEDQNIIGSPSRDPHNPLHPVARCIAKGLIHLVGGGETLIANCYGDTGTLMDTFRREFAICCATLSIITIRSIITGTRRRSCQAVMTSCGRGSSIIFYYNNRACRSQSHRRICIAANWIICCVYSFLR